jgi:hypothetical protein
MGGARGAFRGDEEGERGHIDPRIEEPALKRGVGVVTGAGDARAANKLVENMVVWKQEGFEVGELLHRLRGYGQQYSWEHWRYNL